MILCGFVQETEDHNKFFKAVQHAALNPERAASFVTADVLYKRDNPVPSIFTPKKYFNDYLSLIAKELYGHPEYGENHGDSAGAAGAADRDHNTLGAVCTHLTCKHRKGHETWQCLTRRREQSERDKKLAQAAKATLQETEPTVQLTKGGAEHPKGEAKGASSTQSIAKTRRSFPCRALVNNRECSYGDNCQFSHDEDLAQFSHNEAWSSRTRSAPGARRAATSRRKVVADTDCTIWRWRQSS